MKFYCLLIIAYMFCLKTLFGAESFERSAIVSRPKRTLLYPALGSLRHCFIAGFGIPVEDLEIETVVSGYVLRTQNFLPWNITQLYVKRYQNITARKEESFVESLWHLDEEVALTTEGAEVAERPTWNNYRWILYKAIEAFADRAGLAGRDCVLKSICESAAVPFDNLNGIFGELLHIFLTPSTSVDELSSHADNDFFHAEHLGRQHADCDRIYANCPRSLLARFSDIQSLGNDL